MCRNLFPGISGGGGVPDGPPPPPPWIRYWTKNVHLSMDSIIQVNHIAGYMYMTGLFCPIWWDGAKIMSFNWFKLDVPVYLLIMLCEINESAHSISSNGTTLNNIIRSHVPGLCRSYFIICIGNMNTRLSCKSHINWSNIQGLKCFST